MKKTEQEQFRDRVQSNPAWFMEKALGSKPWDKQVEIAEKVFKNRRVEVRGCVSSTKTFGAAMVALTWLARYKPSRVFSTAPSFRQVDTNLWGYIRTLVAHAEEKGIPLGCQVFKEPRLEFGDGWYYKGFSTNEPSNVHGIHGPNDLLIIDDAHGVPRELTEELENMMAGGNTHILMLYNPVVLSGETYECNNRQKDLWAHVKISFADLEKAYAAGFKIPGALQADTVKIWRAKYGPQSNFCISKIDAEYPKQGKDTLIPMDWIEQAMARKVPQGEGRLIVGCDVAWEGDDTTVNAPMQGRQVLPLEVYQGQDPMQVADLLDIHLLKPGAAGFVDAIGIGAGVYSREAQRGRTVTAIVVSEKAIGQYEGKPAENHFYNLRTQIAWTLREALDPANPEAIALPYDLELQAQLSAIRYFTDEKSGKIRIQLKKEMKKDLGYSPDKADGVAMAVWGKFILSNSATIEKWAAEQAASISTTSESEDAHISEESQFAIAGGSETLSGLGDFNE